MKQTGKIVRCLNHQFSLSALIECFRKKQIGGREMPTRYTWKYLYLRKEKSRHKAAQSKFSWKPILVIITDGRYITASECLHMGSVWMQKIAKKKRIASLFASFPHPLIFPIFFAIRCDMRCTSSTYITTLPFRLNAFILGKWDISGTHLFITFRWDKLILPDGISDTINIRHNFPVSPIDPERVKI